ncbi:hypothetical protein D3C78_1171800 [compost metagenome]
MLVGRVAAPLAISDGGHGGHAGFLQTLDRPPFLARAQNRQLGGEQVLEDLTPANTTVNFHEKPVPAHFSAQGTASFELTVNLTLQAFDFGERIASGPKALERFGKNQLHRCCSARITSAACCGML